MAAKAAKKTASAARGAASVAAKTTKKVVGKEARATASAADKVAKKLGEGLSVDDQMKISQDYNRMSLKKRRQQTKRQWAVSKRLLPKDTRTDAQKMTDATGPRPGSRYRGD